MNRTHTYLRKKAVHYANIFYFIFFKKKTPTVFLLATC